VAEREVLVTGAHGFIGRHVARAYARAGWRVAGLGLGAWTTDEWRSWGLTEWHEAEIGRDLLRGIREVPGVVVHCAGGASVAFSVAHPDEDRRLTVETTRRVLEAAGGRAGAPRVVFVSSGAVYGGHDGRAAEDTPVDPQSPYARHKLEAEELCVERGGTAGVEGVRVRLFSVHGPGLRKQLLWDACSKLTRGEWSFAGTGREVRDWLYVDDAAALVVEAGSHASVTWPIVNGGTGVGVTVREVLEELGRAWDGRAGPAFTGVARAGDPVGLVADCALARSWGWSPCVDWREGVRRYVEWFRAEGVASRQPVQ
jgi:UDP-glucose 4-epimerase